MADTSKGSGTWGLLTSNRTSVIFIVISLALISIFGIIIYNVFLQKTIFSKNRSDYEESTENINTETVDNIPNSNGSNTLNNLELPNNIINPSNNLLNQSNNSAMNPKPYQVYNIASNIYTYNDADEVCKAHEGRLATLPEVIEAYKKGAEWCNYGWTQGQLATYPTQKDSWLELQKGPKNNRNNCGRVGVNGGFFQNDEYMFGVNCYGPKPNPKDNEVMRKFVNDTIEQNKYKDKLDLIKISPFNKTKWSQYQPSDE